jgi:hypothetical protein
MAVVSYVSPATGQYYSFNIAGNEPTPDELARMNAHVNQQDAILSEPSEPEADPEENYGYIDAAGDFGQGAGQGFFGSFAQIPGGITAIGEALYGLHSGEDVPTGSTGIGALGKNVSEGLQSGVDAVFGVPEEDTIPGKIGQAAGSIGSFFVPATIGAKVAGAIGKTATAARVGGTAATSVFGSGLGAAEQVARMEQILESGEMIDSDKQNLAVLLGGAVGSLEPFGGAEARVLGETLKILKKVPPSLRDEAIFQFGKRLKRAAITGTQEAAQEAFTGALQNLVEQGIYNPDRGILEGTGEEALIGGGAGFTLDFLLSTMRAPGMRRNFNQIKELELEGDTQALAEKANQFVETSQLATDKNAVPMQEGVAPTGDEQLALPAPSEAPAGMKPEEAAVLDTSAEIESKTDFSPVKLVDLPLEERLAISTGRSNRGEDPNPLVTLEEIQAVLGQESASREAAKQKPATLGQTKFAPLTDKPFSEEQYTRAVARLKADGSVKFNDVRKALKPGTKEKIPNAVVNSVIEEMEKRGVAKSSVETKGGREVRSWTVDPMSVSIDSPETSIRREIDDLYKGVEEAEIKRNGLASDIERKKAGATVSPAGFALDEDGNPTTQRVKQIQPENRKKTLQQLAAEKEALDTQIVDSKARLAEAERELGTARRDRVPSTETTAPPAPDPRKMEVPAYQGNPLSEIDKQISTLSKDSDRTKSQIEQINAQEGAVVPQELEETYAEQQAQLAVLSGQRARVASESADPNSVIAARQKQSIANEAMTIATILRESPQYSQKYLKKQAAVLNRLRTMLDEMGLSRVKLQGVRAITPSEDTFAEGSYSEQLQVIALSMGVYDPKLTEAELFDRLAAVTNHEAIHALKAMNVFSDKEWESLVRMAETRRYVLLNNGKKIERRYTYLERAVKLGYSPEIAAEEAVAEMYRDWADGKIKVGGQPVSMFMRIKKFFRSIIKAHTEEGFTSVDQIFSGIQSGAIGNRQSVLPTESSNELMRLSALPTRKNVDGRLELLKGRTGRLIESGAFTQQQVDDIFSLADDPYVDPKDSNKTAKTPERIASDKVTIKSKIANEIEDIIASNGMPVDRVAMSHTDVLAREELLKQQARFMSDFSKRVAPGVPPAQLTETLLFGEEQVGKEYRAMRDLYRKIVRIQRPIRPWQDLAPIATDEQASTSLRANQLPLWGAQVADGELVQLRLDIPAYRDHDAWIVSIHDPAEKDPTAFANLKGEAKFGAGRAKSYGPTAVANNVSFGMGQKSALDIASGSGKGTIATMSGEYVNMTPSEAVRLSKEAMNDPSWVQVGMDPLRASYFYDRKTGEPVVSADQVIQIGGIVFAKNSSTASADQFLYSALPRTTRTDSPAFKQWFSTSVVRAGTKPMRVFHGTKADFNSFRDVGRNQLGFHVGTVEQADSFVAGVGDRSLFDSDEEFAAAADKFLTQAQNVSGGRDKRNVMPLYVRMKSPVYLEDRGQWDGETIATQLYEQEIIDKEELDSLIDGPLSNIEVEPYLDKDMFMREYLKDLGYDGVIYLNRIEGLSARDVSLIASTSGEYAAASDNEFKYRFPSAQKSYIVFDPNQLKSTTGNDGSYSLHTGDVRYSKLPRTATTQTLQNYIKNHKDDGWTIHNENKIRAYSGGGYVVAPTKLSEIIVANKDDVPIDVLLQYIEDNKNLSGLVEHEVFLGGWVNPDNNLLYMDNTIILPNLEEALYYADAAEQIAIFDLNTFEGVDTKNGIAELEQSGAYSGEQALRYNENARDINRKFTEARDNYRRVSGLSRAKPIPQTEKFSVIPLTPSERKLTILDRMDNNGRFIDTAPKNAKGKRQFITKESAMRILQNERGDVVFADTDEKTQKTLAKIMSAELLETLQYNSDAIGWYDSKLKLAKQVFAMVHPEILTDQDSARILDYVTAVTSNGMAVIKNYQSANIQYENWKETGRLLEEGYGDQGGSMIAAFKLYNTFKDQGKSDQQFYTFLNSDFSVKELRQDPLVKELDIKINSSELAETIVKGSYVIGPKIGQGFYQNLNGNFNELTMDRWFMRFFNRVTGRPFKPVKDELVLNNIDRVRKALTKNDITALEAKVRDDAMESIGYDVGTDENLLLFSTKVEELWNKAYKGAYKDRMFEIVSRGEDPNTKESKTEAQNARPQKTELFLATGNLNKNSVEQLQEDPRNGNDRLYMRKVIRKVQTTLKNNGYDLTIADIQAQQWYAEKRLWDSLGVRKGQGDDNDYVDGAIALAQLKGITDEEIAATLPTTDRHRLDSGTDSGESDGGVYSADRDLTGQVQEGTGSEFPATEQEVRENKLSKPDTRYSIIPMTRLSRLQSSTARTQNKIMYTNAANMIAKIMSGRGLLMSDKNAQARADTIVRKFQDAFIPVGRMVDDLRMLGMDIPDAFDTYLLESQYHNIASNLLENATKSMHNPLIEYAKRFKPNEAEINRIKAVSGFARYAFEDTQSTALSMVDTYLYARHAKERNDYINSITDKPEFKNQGSGMTNAEADAIISWFRSSRFNTLLPELEAKVKTIIKSTNDARLEGGLIGTGTFEYVDDATGETKSRPQYEFYIPLRGNPDENGDMAEPTNMGPYRSPLYGAKRREDRQATGRISYADNMLANLIVQNQNSLVRSERNKVGKSMIDLFQREPAMMSAFGRIVQTNEMPKTAYVNKYGNRVEMVSRDFRDRPDVFIAKQDGKEVMMQFYRPEIAQALKGAQSNLNNNGLVRAMGTVNRYLSTINTSLNPEFIISNALRDLQTAGVNVQQFEGAGQGLTKTIAKSIPATLKGIRAAIIDGDTTSEWAKVYNDFVTHGGKNATNQVNTLQDQILGINGVIGGIAENGKLAKWNKVKDSFVGKKTSSLLSTIENYNTVVENGVRVATYKALIDRGLTKARAAEAARNVTVNFSKGGELRGFMNAMYLFYNASLQGSFALITAAVKSPRVRAMWLGSVGVGVAQDMINSFVSDDDDDGEKQYDKIPRYVLEHNIILPDFFGFSDRSYITIPMPYGLNMAHNAGRAIARTARGGYTSGQATETIFGTMIDTLNPLGGTESWANAALPTVADPFFDMYDNEDYAKKPIYKTGYPGDTTPSSQLYWSTTNPSFVWLANNINSITGGNAVRNGYVDISPDVIEYWYDFMTGGIGRFTTNAASAPARIAEEGITNESIKSIPFFKKLVGTVSDREDVGLYVEKKEKVLLAEKDIKDAIEQRDPQRIKQIRKDYAEELRLVSAIKSIENERRKVRKIINNVNSDKNIDETRRQAILERSKKRLSLLTIRGLKLMGELD